MDNLITKFGYFIDSTTGDSKTTHFILYLQDPAPKEPSDVLLWSQIPWRKFYFFNSLDAAEYIRMLEGGKDYSNARVLCLIDGKWRNATCQWFPKNHELQPKSRVFTDAMIFAYREAKRLSLGKPKMRYYTDSSDEELPSSAGSLVTVDSGASSGPSPVPLTGRSYDYTERKVMSKELEDTLTPLVVVAKGSPPLLAKTLYSKKSSEKRPDSPRPTMKPRIAFAESGIVEPDG